MARVSIAPPPVFATPPSFGKAAGALAALALLAAAGFFCGQQPTVLFLLKHVVFLVLVVLTPTVAKWIADAVFGAMEEDNLGDEAHRLTRAAAEVVIFAGLIYGFAFWLTGRRLSWHSTAYVIGIILLIEAGAHIVEWHQRRILKRVARVQIVDATVKQLRALTRRERWLYASIPLGIAVTAIVAAIGRFNGDRTLSLMIRLVLLSACVGLAIFLTISLLQMVTPIFVEAAVPAIETKPDSTLVKPVVVQVPLTRQAKKEQQARDLDILVVISDLRKVYFYNSLHNVVLLAIFGWLILNSTSAIEFKWWFVSAAVVTTVLGYLPYGIGQMLMRDRALHRFEGKERRDMEGQLKKYAPVFPKLEFIAGLVATPAAGFLVTLLDDLLKKRVQ